MSGPAAPGGVRLDVLGTVAVRHGDRALSGHELGGRRAHVALVALALTSGPVSADRLAALIWTAEPGRPVGQGRGRAGAGPGGAAGRAGGPAVAAGRGRAVAQRASPGGGRR